MTDIDLNKRKIRFGLCCVFRSEKIRFRTTTAKVLLGMDAASRLSRVSAVCLENGANLVSALHACRRLGIGSFRILSTLFPRMTHPDVGYFLEELPDAESIRKQLQEVRSTALAWDIRLSFHPDPFVVLSSPDSRVVENSVRELEYHAMLARETGADTINIHAGGVYGDKKEALRRFINGFSCLSEEAGSRLALENDDVRYTVADLLPVCRELAIPLVYDVHHHRCNPDGLSVEDATGYSAETWNQSGREPYCHLSSPKNGWNGGDPRPHADTVDPADFPRCWAGRTMTVDIEAKFKEVAVVELMKALGRIPGFF